MNIAEILKYCPKGTKLYSNIFGEVTFDRIDIDEKYPIIVYKLDCMKTSFTEEGHYTDYPNSECVLFPSKDQRDWKKFRLPVKRGDIMMTTDKRAFITTGKVDMDGYSSAYCGINIYHTFAIGTTANGWTALFYIPASEEAKKELFNKMEEAGYKWNADTLELKKIEPKFKEGDVVIDNQDNLCLVSKIRDDGFITITAAMYTNKALNVFTSNSVDRHIQLVTIASTTDRNKLYSALTRKGYKYDKEQHILVKQEFKPFEKVLVRDDTNKKWSIDLFSYYDEENKNFPYVCMHIHYCYCIPYEGNEYLLGTTDSPTCVDKKE